MRKIRILIVDDSVVARRILSDMICSDPSLELAGTAVNGEFGLRKIEHLKPDVVILDSEMPVINGIEMLCQLRQTHPLLPVIMFTTDSQAGAALTIEALACGASDFITRPSGVSDPKILLTILAEQLIRKIKILFKQNSRRREPSSIVASSTVAAPVKLKPRAKISDQKIEMVAIGSSTGGPAALDKVLMQIGRDLPVPIVIVQHMPAMFTRLLAERLTDLVHFPVHEAAHDMPALPGHVYIAPGDYHMELKRIAGNLVLHTHEGPRENSCRPSVDVLFRSVAHTMGAATLGVILTGMGQDGFQGAKEILRAGGSIWAQDEATSVVWGMPGVVARAGLSEKILPLSEIGNRIRKRVMSIDNAAIHGECSPL